MVHPLEGVRVVDLTRLLPGPVATWVLAALGAEVVKVEDPNGGDPTRWVPPLVGDPPTGALFHLINRGKKSVALDLKTEAGQAALRHLVAHSDVLVEGFRPGVVARLGLGDDFLDACPGLVFVSLSGFGASGPDAHRSGHDVGYVARAGGWAPAVGAVPDGLTPMQVADVGGAWAMVAAVTAGLVRKYRTGLGSRVDLSMTEVATTFGLTRFAELQADAQSGPQALLDGSRPCYGLYPASDGHVAVGALEPKFWQAFCRALDREDLVPHAFDGGEVGARVRGEVARILAQHPRSHWARVFRDVDACVEPVLAPDEVLRDAQLRARSAVTPDGPQVPLRFSPMPDSLDPAPALGAHTDQVFESVDLDPQLWARIRPSGRGG